MTWHADTDMLSRYAQGRLLDAAAWSLEAHVTACGACRHRLAEVPAVPAALGVGGSGPDDRARLDGVWAEVSDRVRARRRPFVERALAKAGVPDHDARLLAATPSLTASWLLGVVAVLGLGVSAAWATHGEGSGSLLVFLLLAPLVPVAGVAVAFGPRVDPTYALGVVAPMHSARLLLLRAVAVLVTSLALAACAAVALPAAGWAAVAWLLPALALSTAVLAASSRWHPLRSASVIGGVWVSAVVLVEVRAASPLGAFGPEGQALMLLVLAAALGLLVIRRDRLDPAAQR